MRIRVTWPDRTYHGNEWPPSPWRLFSALLAGYGNAALEDPELNGALRHLAELDPPTILAPPAREDETVAVTTAVPNNDGDRAFALFAADKRHEALSQLRKNRELRPRTRRHIGGDGTVTYSWPDTGATGSQRPALERLARGLCALGQGTDTAWGTLMADGAPDPADCLRWEPRADGKHLLEVPEADTLADLVKRYRRCRAHIRPDGIVLNIPEAPRAKANYRCSLDPPAQRSMLFLLRTPDDRPWSRPGPEAMAIAARTRHAVNTAAERIGFAPDLVTDLMGHGDHSRRVTPIPVPNVGYRHADGRVRRVLMTAPASLDADTWDTLMYRLVGAELAPPGQEPIAILVPAPRDDLLQPAFLAPAVRWISATPIVLPGWDSRRGKPRPEKALRRLLRHAAISPDLLEAADFHPAPMLPGAMPGTDAHLPQHLEARPRVHLELRWTQPVPGPIALGAGVGYGYGLMRAA